MPARRNASACGSGYVLIKKDALVLVALAVPRRSMTVARSAHVPAHARHHGVPALARHRSVSNRRRGARLKGTLAGMTSVAVLVTIPMKAMGVICPANARAEAMVLMQEASTYESTMGPSTSTQSV